MKKCKHANSFYCVFFYANAFSAEKCLVSGDVTSTKYSALYIHFTSFQSHDLTSEKIMPGC